jgi:hypothetical protein
MKRHGHHHHGGSGLSPRQRRLTYVCVGAAWLSGALWLVFHYVLQRQGEFALEPHPLEAWWLRVHGACAFVLLWLGGLLWAVHVRPGLRWPGRRTSGIAIMLAFCVLAATGYLIYYAEDGTLRDGVTIVHWVLGLALLLPLVLHLLPSVLLRRQRRAR